jgi:ABC-type phosphate/phosphonate transport system substrate-binding protein
MIGNASGRQSRAIAAGALILACGAIGRAADFTSSEPVHLNLGFSGQIFVNVESAESRSVMKVLASEIVRRHFTNGTSESLILGDDSSIRQAFLEKRIDMAAITTDEYVRLRGRAPIQPILTATAGHDPYHSVVLLVRRDAGIRSLAELQGKRLTLSTDQSKSIHLTWLETLLMKQGVQRTEAYFSAIKEAKRPSQAILPVFFQQADACLTTQQAFDVVRELNPQIGSDLVVLVRSPSLVSGVMVFRTDFDPGVKGKILEILQKLPMDANGSQILRMFRMNELLPWRPEYLETVEALLSEHERLRKNLERRK